MTMCIKLITTAVLLILLAVVVYMVCKCSKKTEFYSDTEVPNELDRVNSQSGEDVKFVNLPGKGNYLRRYKKPLPTIGDF